MGALGARDKEAISSMVDRVEAYGRAMWSNSPFDRVRIEALLAEAYRVHDDPFNEAAAARWGAENFPDGIPRAAVDECELATPYCRAG